MVFVSLGFLPQLLSFPPQNTMTFLLPPITWKGKRYFKYEFGFRVDGIICFANHFCQTRQWPVHEEENKTKLGWYKKLQTIPLHGHGLRVQVFKAEDTKSCGIMQPTTNRSGQHNWLEGKSKQGWSKNNPNYAACMDAHSPSGESVCCPGDVSSSSEQYLLWCIKTNVIFSCCKLAYLLTKQIHMSSCDNLESNTKELRKKDVF